MKRLVLLGCLVLTAVMLFGSLMDEAIAIKGWLDVPFSASSLEAERDSKIKEIQNPVKGEFETTSQFEQRKKDAGARKASIQKEYEQKIRDARSAYDSNLSKLRQRLTTLLISSREMVQLSGTLGSYDADNQKFIVTIPEKSFQIVVPLDKAPSVKQNIGSYKLMVTRQLNENLGWDYLEAKLVGSAGTFASTDRAPVQGQSSASVALIPPDLKVTLTFSEPSGNNILEAEESAQVKISVRNEGKGSANMVEATFDLLNAQGVSFSRSLYFGEIAAGETISKTLQLVAGSDTRDTQAELKIGFTEQNGFPPDNVNLSFNTSALRAPDLYVADIGIDDFSGNNKIEPGEQVEIKARIQNRGLGTARNVSVEILTGTEVYLSGNSAKTFPLGDMASGDYKDVVFSIVTAKIAKQLELKLELKESRAQFSKPAQELNLAFNRVERTADQLLVTGKQNEIQIAAAPALSIDVEQNIPLRGKTQKNRWGVILGIETYKNVSRVSYAKRDAEIMRDYFTKVLGIPDANLYMKTNEEASLGEFKTVFDPSGWLSKNAGSKDSEIFIYYSGHGVPTPDGKQAYLLPYDGNPDYARNSAYALDQLYENLGAIKARSITLFLDSCFSGVNRDNEIILADA
ncbi:MAG TPA: CARDB domain-containing protein, partial [Candidatus Cloacimonadota bacterium]|nr:CARDB domain-containing protein [Candidatus Cloacimonadota bacterium]